MRKAVPRLFALLIIPLGVVFLYALVHEASHALVVFLVGGEVTRFQVNFLQHAPSISYTGVSDPLHKAFISLAGPVLPLALVPFVAVVLRKTRSALAQAAALLLLLSLLPTALTSAAIALVYGFGAVPPQEDMAKFLHYTGANPFAAAAVLLLVFVVLLVFAFRVGRVKEAALNVQSVLRGSRDRRHTLLMGRIVVAVVLLSVGAAALRSIIGSEVPGSPELSYHTKVEVNLGDVTPDSAVYHTFSVSKPTVFDFVYSVDSGSDITMRLLNLDGEPFVFNNKDSVVMYEGRRTQPLAYFTGFTLLEGNYALEVSPGSTGSLTMYVDSREPSPANMEYLELLSAVNTGSFTAQSYHEEGYELVYEGELGVGQDQFLLTLPGGTDRMISAFAVGNGQVNLVYAADDEVHTLLEGFKATIGRWLPPHKGAAEVRASVQQVPTVLYIYVKANRSR